MLLAIAITSLVLAAVPFGLFLVNLRLFRRAPKTSRDGMPRISVLIPARNEERSIEACVRAVLASCDVHVELIVLDDQSTDRTGEMVDAIAREDARVRLEHAPPLPAGWCGKQHACHVLSRLASHDWLVFIDADVRLSPDALSRAVGFAEQARAPLVSGFPRQETGTSLEKLLIPLIHVVLLGYLPIMRMRASAHPSYAAGCGQFFLAKRDAYMSVGGHAAIRRSLHDGITLPRAFRAAGHQTDLFDATDVASCRMYRSASEVWNGLAKNATEGMASARAIGLWTVLLGTGHVLPLVLMIIAAMLGKQDVLMISALALELGLGIRLLAAIRFRQSLAGALLHPVGVAVLLCIQWYALARHLSGHAPSWKGRSYVATARAAA